MIIRKSVVETTENLLKPLFCGTKILIKEIISILPKKQEKQKKKNIKNKT